MVKSGKLRRRDFLGALAVGATALSIGTPFPRMRAQEISQDTLPPHLKGYEKLYQIDPRAASRAWFREANFGLFMHYGVYSLLGHGEWVQLREKIPVKEYEKLKMKFTAEKFDADKITDMALAAGMKYVNITSKHHDGFCLFKTKQTDFNSTEAPARRDLIGELAETCHKKGLGLFLYYSYALDWRHPYFYSRAAGWKNARPDYDFKESRYLWRQDKDFEKYIQFVHNQLRELLTQYGPLAGIWFDPIMGYYARPDLFPIEETYALVRSLQPHCLISFKQGASGDEDFATPERGVVSLVERVRKMFGPDNAKVAQRAWVKNRIKKFEICDTLQKHAWGYDSRQDGKHRTTNDVMEMLANAHDYRANLLLNTGPLADGSIYSGDRETLLRVGERLRKDH